MAFSNLLLEQNTLESSLFFFRLSLKMATSSVNVNLSAKLEISLSFSVLLPSGQIVEVTGGTDTVLIPAFCTENLAFTDRSEASTNVEEILEPMATEEPVSCSSRELPSEKPVPCSSRNLPSEEPVSCFSRDLPSENVDTNCKGPLSDKAMRSLKAKWESFFERPCDSSLPAMSPPLLSLPAMSPPLPSLPAMSPPLPSLPAMFSPLPSLPAVPPVAMPNPSTSMPDSLPMCPLSLSFPTSSAFVNTDSPASPSFLSVDPNDLFWIPLPCRGENFDMSLIESVLEKEGELVVEVDLDKMDSGDDDVVFLGEFKNV